MPIDQLTDEIRAAIQAFADEQKISFDEAVRVILADWLIAHSFLQYSEDEEGE